MFPRGSRTFHVVPHPSELFSYLMLQYSAAFQVTHAPKREKPHNEGKYPENKKGKKKHLEKYVVS